MSDKSIRGLHMIVTTCEDGCTALPVTCVEDIPGVAALAVLIEAGGRVTMHAPHETCALCLAFEHKMELATEFPRRQSSF